MMEEKEVYTCIVLFIFPTMHLCFHTTYGKAGSCPELRSNVSISVVFFGSVSCSFLLLFIRHCRKGLGTRCPICYSIRTSPLIVALINTECATLCVTTSGFVFIMYRLLGANNAIKNAFPTQLDVIPSSWFRL